MASDMTHASNTRKGSEGKNSLSQSTRLTPISGQGKGPLLSSASCESLVRFVCQIDRMSSNTQRGGNLVEHMFRIPKAGVTLKAKNADSFHAHVPTVSV